jgi:hypothetical protein
MSGQPASQHARRRRWPLWGLLLVGLFLGHDAFMAAEAVAAPHASGMHAAPIVGPHDGGAWQRSAPEPGHPAQCRVGQSALARGGDDGAVSLPRPMLPSLAVILPGSTSRITRLVWEEPHWPPGTQRALSQMYRL